MKQFVFTLILAVAVSLGCSKSALNASTVNDVSPQVKTALNAKYPTKANDFLDALSAKFPGALVYEVDFERNGVEFKVKDNKKFYEVDFDLEANWLKTTREVRLSSVPDNVVKALKASEYYTTLSVIDRDVTYVETPEYVAYKFEVEKVNSSYEVLVDIKGVVTLLDADFD